MLIVWIRFIIRLLQLLPGAVSGPGGSVGVVSSPYLKTPGNRVCAC